MALDPTVQTAIVGGIFGTLAILLDRRRGRDIKRVEEHAAEARYQVQNSHKSNLRDDIDRVLEGIDALHLGQRMHSSEIGGLRAELRQERVERLDVARRLDDHLRGLRDS